MTELPRELQDFNLLIASSEQFTMNFERKFSEGMRKYKTPLASKNCTNEALQEVYDLYAYLFTQKQINANLTARAKWMLDTLAITAEVRSFCEAVVFHLGEKPLAQKINPTEAQATASASSLLTEQRVSLQEQQQLHDPEFVAEIARIEQAQACSPH